MYKEPQNRSGCPFWLELWFGFCLQKKKKTKTFCCFKCLALDNWIHKINIFLLFNKSICCGYSLEVPHWGTSYEYQTCFSQINTFWFEKKFLVGKKKVPYLELWNFIKWKLIFFCLKLEIEYHAWTVYWHNCAFRLPNMQHDISFN